MAMAKNITVYSNINKNIKINGFREKVARAVLSLIDNAVKYTPVKGKIEITLEKAGSKALIVIKDNGSGISRVELKKIFNRFYRGAKTEKVLGSGLGLAISKSIVVLHQGEIKVKSAVGKGSTFVIVLPTV